MIVTHCTGPRCLALPSRLGVAFLILFAPSKGALGESGEGLFLDSLSLVPHYLILNCVCGDPNWRIGRPRLESYEIAHEFAHAEFAHEAVSSCISIEHLKPLRATFSSSSSCACGCRSRCSPRTLSYPWSRPGADDPSRSSCRSSRARPRPHPPRTPRSHLWS